MVPGGLTHLVFHCAHAGRREQWIEQRAKTGVERRIKFGRDHRPAFADRRGKAVGTHAGEMLSVLIGLAYVGGAAEHPGGGAAGIGIGCVENGRPLMDRRSEEHTSELQSIMRISYDVF